MSEPIEFEETTALIQDGDARRAGVNAATNEAVARQLAAEMEKLLAGIEDPEERRRKRREIVEDIDAVIAELKRG